MNFRKSSFLLVMSAFLAASSQICFANGQNDPKPFDDMVLKQHSGDRKFSSEDWKKPNSNRESMLYDLVHSSHLIGMSGSEVQSLLGDPLWQTNSSAFYSLNDKGHTHVFEVKFKDNVVSSFAAGFHFCLGASCVHLSKWHEKPTDQTPSVFTSSFLDTKFWTEIMHGGFVGLNGGEAVLEDCLSRPSNTPFVSNEWKKIDRSLKYKMLYDLVHAHSFIGMEHSKVAEILGKVKGESYIETKLPIKESQPNIESFDRYPVLLLGRGGDISRPYIVFDIGYHNDHAVAFRVSVETNGTRVPTCMENMGHLQTDNFAQTERSGGLSTSMQPSAGN